MKTIKCKYFGYGWNPRTGDNDIPNCCTVSDSPCEVDPEKVEICQRNTENILIAEEYELEDY